MLTACFKATKIGFEFVGFYKIENEKKNRMSPVRIELATPGLQDQCYATELKGLYTRRGQTNKRQHFFFDTDYCVRSDEKNRRATSEEYFMFI